MAIQLDARGSKGGNIVIETRIASIEAIAESTSNGLEALRRRVEAVVGLLVRAADL